MSASSDRLPPGIPDVPAVVEVLNRHGVRYVVIGGWVAQAYVESYVTEDVDFTPATDPDNLERLSAALTELGARIRTEAVPEGLPFAHDAAGGCYPPMGRRRIRMPRSSMTAMAPTSRSASRAVRLARRTITCSCGRRRVRRR